MIINIIEIRIILNAININQITPNNKNIIINSERTESPSKIETIHQL